MLTPGVYPASITPFDAKGALDRESLAKLLTWFKSKGCAGAVLAGTNGEGPSLSAPEKVRLLEAALATDPGFDLILGVATPSLSEAIWSSKRAAETGAAAILAMPPMYFRTVDQSGVRDWFRALLDAGPSPVVVYNFPRMTGITITPETLADLADHDRFAGVKDSSGDHENLKPFRQATNGRPLFAGDETTIVPALRAGWSGSISGCANVVPGWLAKLVGECLEGEWESAEERRILIEPVLRHIRSSLPVPRSKAALKAHGVIAEATVKLPLRTQGDDITPVVTEQLGGL